MTDRNSCLFQKALGSGFAALPEAVRDLHSVFDTHSWTGCARVSRGPSRLGSLICNLIGFPPIAENVPVSVKIGRQGNAETWLRDFGGKTFRSVLSLRDNEEKGRISERFGPLIFDIDLDHEGTRLCFPVMRGSFLGCPLPNWILPVSEAFEFEEDGRFNFDVRISLPGIGMLVRYEGWLTNTRPLRHQVLQISE